MIEVEGNSYPTISDLLKVPENERKVENYIDSKRGIFLITSANIRTSSNGKKYTEAMAADEKTTFRVKIWGVVGAGNLVFADYEYSSAFHSFSLKPKKIANANSAPQVAQKLMPHFENIDDLNRCLEYFVKSVENQYLRKLLEEVFFNDREFHESFMKATAASKNHHVGRGGLLYHTISVTKNALNLISNYPSLNRDLLVAGCLLHDIGKVKTYTYGPKFDYTDEGKLENHIVIGIKMLARFVDRIPDFPKELEMILTHILASHHGNLEYGSPVVPKVPEAILIHFVDEMDAKLGAALEAIENVENDSWSERVGILRTDLFKYKI